MNMNMNRTSVRSHESTNTQNTSTDKMTLDRSDSSVTKLCDLHVYKVPPELWRDNLNNVLNNAITETVSVGIIRVPEELSLAELRDEVRQQLYIRGVDLVPRDFVFLRSVGRSLTTLRGKQEQQLKAKHFLPPVAVVPELYILEVTPEVREALANSDALSSALSQRASSPSHTALPHSHRSGYKGDSNNLDIHKPRHSVLLSKPGYKPMPQTIRSMDTSTRIFSRNSLFGSLPNNPNFSKTLHHHSTTYSTHNNNPYNDNNKNNKIPWYSTVEENLDKDRPENSNYNFVRGWPGQAEHGNAISTSVRHLPHIHTTDTSHKQLPHILTSHKQLPHILTSHKQLPHIHTTHRSHKQLPQAHSPDVSIDKLQHWSAGTGRDNSSDGSHNGDLSQDDQYGRRHKGQDGGGSRRAKGNHSGRINSETDSEEEPERQTGNGGNRNTRTSYRKHSDEDERVLSSDEETAASNRRQKLGHEKNHLMRNIEETRMSRQDQEKERADLLRKAKQIQHKTKQYRNAARDAWKKKYFEEKKRTAPLEDVSNVLQNELEALHRKQMNILEGPREKNLRLADGAPSEKSNHVIQCARLRHEIEDLSRRVEMARMKLTSEMKLRVQAQAEMKAVRSEAMQNRLAVRAPKPGHGNTAVVAAAK